jgi:hypothetical protein
MIFKKRKTGSAPINEPKTRIDPFPGSGGSKSSSSDAGSGHSGTSHAARKTDNEEPPTRDAIFDAPVLAIPKSDDPHVGMLVIIEGPGRGFSAPLSYGENSIGRGSGMNVRLDFGDAELSENELARITYDMEARSFEIRPGEEANDIKVGKNIVGKKPRKLKNRDRIRMGNTVLLFLAICSDTFDWRADAAGTQD